jgi:hypothetical protein
VLDQARALQPTQPDILLRRARVLAAMGRTREARAEFHQIPVLDPSNAEARAGLNALAELTKHELRFGADLDTFNYTDPAQAYTINLRSHWTPCWSTLFGTSFYQRFGESASKITASTAYRLASSNWINLGLAVARGRAVIPRRESFVEYGHAVKLHWAWLRGLESSYQARWLWYRDAHVLVGTRDRYALEAFVSELERSGGLEKVVQAIQDRSPAESAANILLKGLAASKEHAANAAGAGGRS